MAHVFISSSSPLSLSALVSGSVFFLAFLGWYMVESFLGNEEKN